MAGLLKEVWLAIIKENFFRYANHLNRSVDMSGFVTNNTLNLAEAGSVPRILKNNKSYPVPVAARNDNAIAIQLDYYDTEGTVISNAESIQYAYNKLSSVTFNHTSALMERFSDIATYNWTPLSDTANTPVFATTGTARSDGRLRFTIADIARMEEVFNRAKFPKQGRILVLCPQHKADLLAQEALLFKSFSDLKTGSVNSLYGFEIYEYGGYATFNGGTGVKRTVDNDLNFDAQTGTDSPSSLFYCETEVMRALGEMDVFFTPKSSSATMRSDIIGYQARFTAQSIRNKACGAIYSGLD
jgi:hypothetical protein